MRRLSLGIVLEALRQVPEALQQYNTDCGRKESDVTAPRAMIRIGAIQFAAEQYKEAAATYDELLVLYPKSRAGGIRKSRCRHGVVSSERI